MSGTTDERAKRTVSKCEVTAVAGRHGQMDKCMCGILAARGLGEKRPGATGKRSTREAA
jgi:hypothetical protein